MKAVIMSALTGSGGFRPELTRMEAPRPGPGELIVNMKACGICGTDLEKIKGNYVASMPVLGHEAVGVVSGVGEGVSEFRVEDRVFPHHHVPCYECYLCKSGNETMCENYRSSNIVPGGLSESFKVPRWNVAKGGVLKLPPGMDFELASLIEPLACCIRAIKRLAVKPSDSVLVVGAGPVGLMNALLLKPKVARVMVSDVSVARLGFAERSGLGIVLNPANMDVPVRVRSETEGRGADLAIVASGSEGAILQGLHSIRKGGRVCLFGVPPKGSVLNFDVSELFNSEQQVVTSYGAAEADTKEALRTLTSRSSEFGKLVTNRFPLAKFEEALDAASSAKAMKVVVTP